MNPVASEIRYLAATAALTGCLWMPIIVNRLREMGVWKALRNPEPDLRPRANWAYRLGHAHRNAVENLVVFAPLALAVHLTGLGSAGTASAAALFFWSRLAHALIYTFGVPLLRTIAFLLGFGAQGMMALRLLGLA